MRKFFINLSIFFFKSFLYTPNKICFLYTPNNNCFLFTLNNNCFLFTPNKDKF